MNDPEREAAPEAIEVHGARVHNLKNLSVRVPLDRLVALTGVSGSGKSTLAFDVLFAEGQRRYLESVSARTRQALSPLERPDVDRIENLPATLCIDQKSGSAHSRSTLATLTEIADFLRLLFARAGQAHCPQCSRPVSRQTSEEIVERILASGDRRKAMLLAPLVRGTKGEHSAVFETIVRQGFVRARVDGTIVDAADPPALARGKPHTIEVVVDRIVIKEGIRPRLVESVGTALRLGQGQCIACLEEEQGWKDLLFSETFSCPDCGVSYPELEPRTLSFNSPYGACPRCEGMGEVPADADGGESREEATETLTQTCPDCGGARLNAFARGVRFRGRTLPEVLAMEVCVAARWFETFTERRISEAAGSAAPADERFSETERAVLEKTVPDLQSRLRFLAMVGLDYLSLDRPAPTLSGGELQRARLAGSLGRDLSGVCYLLDEPTAGLHPADTKRLLAAIARLRSQGNSVLVVEHDLDVVRSCDWVIDLGPGAGAGGGRLVAEGTWEQVAESPDSVTGAYLARRDAEMKDVSSRMFDAPSDWLTLTGARRHNLKNLTARFPLGRMTCVTGVSGSGKSSLVAGTLVPAVRAALADTAIDRSDLEAISGTETLRRLVHVDQSPLGRSGRSTPATYVGLWDDVCRLFARTKEARLRGFRMSRFRYTRAEGRCSVCRGRGELQLRMDLLPPLTISCPDCRGARFNRGTLSVQYRGKHVADVLSMRIDEACDFFTNVERLHRPLQMLADVGLGYLTLGQSALTLSGGEAQRVKLSAELARETHEPTLYVLDEPTTGLHPADVDRLIGVLRRLVQHGHTVIVVEHHPGLALASDWILDLGPGAGRAGGEIVAEGSPQEILQHADSLTAAALRGRLSD